MTTEEREIIANAYDNGTIKVIVATCSLAAGINLPARRVILHGARMGRDMVGPAMLYALCTPHTGFQSLLTQPSRQMRGRAGRKGKDEVGESYLCCQKADLEEVSALIEADIPVVSSCLAPDRRGITRTLLEIIAIRLATTLDAITDHIKRTLLYRANAIPATALTTTILSALSSLTADSLIAHDPSTSTYAATLLGQAVVASSLTPTDGLFVHDEMQRALRAFVMDSEMHVFYMFTPPTQPATSSQINWAVFRDELHALDDSGLRVAAYVGVKPHVVNQLYLPLSPTPVFSLPSAAYTHSAQSGSLPTATAADLRTHRIYHRFYAALQLRDLSNEVPLHAVATKYALPRGVVQTLAQSCQGFAAGMIKFSERMAAASAGWGMLASVLAHMADRLAAGARADLLDLARISGVKSKTARVLWENGIKSVRAVAEMEAEALVPMLELAQGWRGRKGRMDREEEERWRAKVRGKAEMVVRSAGRVWERDGVVELED